MFEKFAASRSEALSRLQDFVDKMPGYGAVRNYVLPGHSNVSRLSPAISHRLITEEEVVRAALSCHPFHRVEKFLQEVLWRGFWKGWLERHPWVWQQYRAACQDYEDSSECVLVAQGRSGTGLMDAFARELLKTGYMHNHARMWWASFWIHYRRLPWHIGARHFFTHLLDADPASNTLSWRWVAGLQTPGKTYLVTEQNIKKYCAPELIEAAGGVDLGGPPDFVRPFSEDLSHLPRELHEYVANDLPCDREELAVLLHDEDMCLETGPLSATKPVLIVQLNPREENAASPRALWLKTARADAAERSRTHFQTNVVSCVSVDEAIGHVANAEVGVLAMMAPFVGPLDDMIRAHQQVAANSNIRVVYFRRQWDKALAPHAGRGFFQYWKRVQPLLKSGLASLLNS